MNDQVTPLHVLVVDDSEDAVELISFFFGRAGHRVDTAGTGGEAIRLTTASRYDAVILDISIPEHDGYEVARAIRTHWAADRPVILALTGHSTDAISERGLDAGFDVILSKPVDLPRLERLVVETHARLASARVVLEPRS
jgi:DNA-binding response OmpR family regulator